LKQHTNQKKSAFEDPSLNFHEAESKPSFYNKIVFSKTKRRLGGNVQRMVSGSAPLNDKTQEFLKIAFGCTVQQGYGLTETSACGTLQDAEDHDYGHCGPPTPNVEIKLVDIPEMNYWTNKDEPEGELWIRGPSVAKGYYLDPTKTAEDFDEDGWFHTGDVARWRKNGTFKIIDRKKNIFKLQHGEYVAAEKLELLFGEADSVNQIFIYGDSSSDSIIALIHPEQLTVRAWAKDH